MSFFVKHIFVLLAFVSTVAVAATTASSPVAERAPQAVSGDLGVIDAEGIPLLARKSNCSACHSINKKMLGPAWMAVSRKYKGVESYEFAGRKYTLEEGLFMKVSKGGAGVWGTTPMPANAPLINNEDIKALVHFVIGLDK